MAFVTKLRAFLDPRSYCVLDSKIAEISQTSERLQRYATCVPITTRNEQAYATWISACSALSSLRDCKWRPIDCFTQRRD